jgi:hypothetical protein
MILGADPSRVNLVKKLFIAALAAAVLGMGMMLDATPAFASKAQFCSDWLARCKLCTGRGVTVRQADCHRTCERRYRACVAGPGCFVTQRGERCLTNNDWPGSGVRHTRVRRDQIR